MKKVLVTIASIIASLSLALTAHAATYVSATANVTTPYKASSSTTGKGQYVLFECKIKNRNTTPNDSNTTSWGDCSLEKLSNGEYIPIKTLFVDETGNAGSSHSITYGGITLEDGVKYRVTSSLDPIHFDEKGYLYAALSTVS
ncbi:hypothetical protein [Cohnella hongkongensis]|uniref:Uncharacterized protein n=1 Tax=Cohnella hongkongensis TaxID=178337 RepID=A0ABV9F558_9BACL